MIPALLIAGGMIAGLLIGGFVAGVLIFGSISRGIGRGLGW